jgi:hypothetical protein
VFAFVEEHPQSWRNLIEKLGNGRDDLSRRERLLQEDAIGNAMGGPLIGSRARHVNDWDFRVEFSGTLGNVPSREHAKQMYVVVR